MKALALTTVIALGLAGTAHAMPVFQLVFPDAPMTVTADQKDVQPILIIEE